MSLWPDIFKGKTIELSFIKVKLGDPHAALGVMEPRCCLIEDEHTVITNRILAGWLPCDGRLIACWVYPELHLLRAPYYSVYAAVAVPDHRDPTKVANANANIVPITYIGSGPQSGEGWVGGLHVTRLHDYMVATIPGCECGSDKVGQPGHSDWCPKHT